MRMNSRVVGATVGALCLCGSVTASYASSQSQPGISTGAITGAPLPDGIYNIIDLNWGQRGPYQGSPEVDIGVANPLHIIAFLPYRVLDAHPFFAVESVWAQVNVGNGYSQTIANLRGFAAQKFDAGLTWVLGGGVSVSVRSGVWIPVNSQVSLRDFWVSQTNLAIAYVNNGWALNADFAYGTGQNGSAMNVAPANVAFGEPATAGNAYGVVNLTALKHIEKWELGIVGFGSDDLSSPYPGYLRQSQFALGGLVGYDFGAIKGNIRLTRDVYQENEGGYDTRVWMSLFMPIWVFAKPEAVTAKY